MSDLDLTSEVALVDTPCVSQLIIQRRSAREAHMKRNQKLWFGLATLVASLSILFFLAVDLIGIGPNLGLSFGYYGRLNRILARIETKPELEVRRVDLHRDSTLEDFYITVRTPSDGDVRLRFEGASDRPFGDLLQELEKVGM